PVVRGVEPLGQRGTTGPAARRLGVVDVGGIGGGRGQVHRRGELQVEEQRVLVGGGDGLHRFEYIGRPATELDRPLERRLRRRGGHQPARVEVHPVAEVER